VTKGFVKVPTEIVRNENVKLSSGDFSLYVRLSHLYFKNYQNPEMKVDHKKLMWNTGISDTRTLKKRLKSLYENKLILNKIDKLPRRGEVNLLFNNKVIADSKMFTMLNLSVFNYIQDINDHAFRLLFYYKSYINTKLTDYEGEKKVKDYCYVGVETIKHHLKIGSDTLTEANKILVKNKLIKIKRNHLKTEYNYNDETNELIYDRYHNHYYINKNLF
jgi:hypothetical protein